MRVSPKFPRESVRTNLLFLNHIYPIVRAKSDPHPRCRLCPYFDCIESGVEVVARGIGRVSRADIWFGALVYGYVLHLPRLH